MGISAELYNEIDRLRRSVSELRQECERLNEWSKTVWCTSCLNSGWIDSDGTCGNCPLGRVKGERQLLKEENERLKSGRFTQAELQNLCHTFSEQDKKAFCNGCIEYQKKLFGESPTDKLKKAALDVYNNAYYYSDALSTVDSNLIDELKIIIDNYFEDD
jgi:hypothetical protein